MASKTHKAKTRDRIKNGKVVFISKDVVRVPLGETGLLVPVGHKPGTTYKKDENLSDPS